MFPCFQTDLNQSGFTDAADMPLYTDYYTAGDPRADTNEDERVADGRPERSDRPVDAAGNRGRETIRGSRRAAVLYRVRTTGLKGEWSYPVTVPFGTVKSGEASAVEAKPAGENAAHERAPATRSVR